MTAATKLAQKRLTLLQLAEKLGNVSKACQMHKVSRSQFYEYKRAFQLHGLDGLIDKPPIPASHPNELSDEVKQRIVDLSLEHPACGQQRIADQLALEGIAASATSVRNLWIRQNMETRYKRLLRLEEAHAEKGFELTEPQIRLIEKANPCFRERHVESNYPGQLLCQDTFYVGRLKGVGRIYLQAVVDTYGSFGFAKLYTSKRPETAVDALYDRVLPFYEEHGLAVEAILTDNGTEYKGRPMIHLYELYLELNDIEHRKTKVGNPIPGPTALSNGSTALCSTSSFDRAFARSSTNPSRLCKTIWTNGFIITTANVPIADIATWAGVRSRPSK